MGKAKPVYVVSYKGDYYDDDGALIDAMVENFYSEGTGHFDVVPQETAWWLAELEDMELIDLNDPDKEYSWKDIEDKLGWII